AWIGKRINDPDMVKACADIRGLDDRCRWHIHQALDAQHSILSPVRATAWKHIVNTKRERKSDDFDENWYVAARKIKLGQADFQSRQLVCRILRPRLEVHRPLGWNYKPKEPNAAEILQDLIRFEFNPAEHPSAAEIMKV